MNGQIGPGRAKDQGKVLSFGFWVLSGPFRAPGSVSHAKLENPKRKTQNSKLKLTAAASEFLMSGR
jgi:hypothetical protein